MPDGQTLYYHYYQDGKNKGQLQAINKNAWWGLTTTQLISELDDNHWDGQTRVRYGNGLLTTINNTNGNITREIDYDFHFRDRSNCNDGKPIWKFGPIEITDDYFQQFHQVGMAKEYDLEVQTTVKKNLIFWITFLLRIEQ